MVFSICATIMSESLTLFVDGAATTLSALVIGVRDSSMAVITSEAGGMIDTSS